MGRITWVCATCSQPFTRNASATRHNNNKHYGLGEIVPLLEYIVGRETGRYMPSNPLWYGPNQKWQTRLAHNSNSEFGRAAVADSIDDRFRPKNGPQQATWGNMNKASLYSNSPVFRPTFSTADQRYGSLRPQGRMQKIAELKTLVNKYHSYFPNAYEILSYAVYCSNQGDDKFLDEKLAEFRDFETFQR